MKNLKDRKKIKKEIRAIQKKIYCNTKNLHGSEKKLYKLNSYKEFERIYIKYGSKLYSKYVPRKYRNKDIKNLIKDGRFLELYNEYQKNDKKVKVLSKNLY